MDMLQRVLEPEVMDDPDEANAYDQMDHAAVNQRFVDDLLATGNLAGELLDLGTGTARIPIMLCLRSNQPHITACDAATSMLALAQRHVAEYGLSHRIGLCREDAKRLSFADGQFDVVMSNSLIHHLAEPGQAIAELLRVVRPSGRIFIRDLMRPESDARIEQLVEQYAGQEPRTSRQLFRQSLAAALSLDEMRGLVAAHQLPTDQVRATSDRHWTWSTSV